MRKREKHLAPILTATMLTLGVVQGTRYWCSTHNGITHGLRTPISEVKMQKSAVAIPKMDAGQQVEEADSEIQVDSPEGHSEQPPQSYFQKTLSGQHYELRLHIPDVGTFEGRIDREQDTSDLNDGDRKILEGLIWDFAEFSITQVELIAEKLEQKDYNLFESFDEATSHGTTLLNEGQAQVGCLTFKQVGDEYALIDMTYELGREYQQWIESRDDLVESLGAIGCRFGGSMYKEE